MLMIRTLFGGLALLLPLALAPPAFAADDADWSNVRDAARAHASAIRQAWSALDGWITGNPAIRNAAPTNLYGPAHSGNPDDRTEERPPYDWNKGPNTGAWDHTDGKRHLLPAAIYSTAGGDPTGLWREEWTRRGLSFRYCDDVLIVFARKPLRGAGHADIQAAGGLQRVNADGKSVTGTPQSGNPSLTLPDCLGTIPKGVVALAGSSLDPFGWRNTRRRNLVTHWQIACEDSPRNASSLDEADRRPVGAIRYAQTVPVELHPWQRDSTGQPTDMKRWPASCEAREDGEFTAADWSGGSFPYAAAVTIPREYPDGRVFFKGKWADGNRWHGLCDPERGDSGDELPGALDYATGPPWLLKEGGTGRPKVSTPVHLEAAVIDDACLKEADIGRETSEAPEWLFYDTLCRQAVAAGIAENAPPPFHKQTVTSDGTSVGTPPRDSCLEIQPIEENTNRLTGCGCPSEYSEAPKAAAGWKIEKIRWLWKEARSGWTTEVSEHYTRKHNDTGADIGKTTGHGWGQAHRRFHPDPGSSPPTNDCIRRTATDFRHCYKLVQEDCGSAAGFSDARTWTGLFKVDDSGVIDKDYVDPDTGNAVFEEKTVTYDIVTGSVTYKVYHPHSGGRKEYVSDTCSYSSSAGGVEEGCNWSDTDSDGSCDD